MTQKWPMVPKMAAQNWQKKMAEKGPRMKAKNLKWLGKKAQISPNKMWKYAENIPERTRYASGKSGKPSEYA